MKSSKWINVSAAVVATFLTMSVEAASDSANRKLESNSPISDEIKQALQKIGSTEVPDFSRGEPCFSGKSK